MDEWLKIAVPALIAGAFSALVGYWGYRQKRVSDDRLTYLQRLQQLQKGEADYLDDAAAARGQIIEAAKLTQALLTAEREEKAELRKEIAQLRGDLKRVEETLTAEREERRVEKQRLSDEVARLTDEVKRLTRLIQGRTDDAHVTADVWRAGGMSDPVVSGPVRGE